MTAAELAALLAFHADSGVEWLLEDAPVDRMAQFAAEKRARAELKAPAATRAEQANQSPVPSPRERMAAQTASPPSSSSGPTTPRATIPDDAAIAEARLAAESATSLEELRAALHGFAGCNLKLSARSTLFAEGPADSGIMIIGPMPSADDDREGVPFSGRAGALLDRMLGAISLSRDKAMLTTAIAWRPPGDRSPTRAEAEICRPFIERQIALAAPRTVLLLGNFTARFFLNSNGTIHSQRGQWHKLAAGDHTTAALATFHPHDLLTAPATKALAWRDLLAFHQHLQQTSD